MINNTLSDLKLVPYGVPQCSVFGPTFCLLYIDDVVKTIEIFHVIYMRTTWLFISH